MNTLTLADWTSILSTSFAAIAAGAAAWAIWMNRKIAQEQRAADAVKRFTELALQYPGLSTDEDKRDEQRTDWFIQFVLLIMDDILKAHKREREWERFAESQLELFGPELANWSMDDIHGIGPDARRIVAKFVKK